MDEPKAMAKTLRSLEYNPGARNRQRCHMIQGTDTMIPVIRDILMLVMKVSIGEVAMNSTFRCCLVSGKDRADQMRSQYP
jgi:hypothetical protein